MGAASTGLSDWFIFLRTFNVTCSHNELEQSLPNILVLQYLGGKAKEHLCLQFSVVFFFFDVTTATQLICFTVSMKKITGV